MMIIDPPSPFAPASEWKEFLDRMETLALELSRDAALARRHANEAKRQLRIPLTTTRFICPQCKQKGGVDISYGYPSPELFEEVERNEAVLGGCMQEIGSPDRQCLSCGHQWPIVRRARSKERAQQLRQQ